METKIDLSKILAKKLPVETVKADFGDGNGERDYEIKALDDASFMCVQALYSSSGDKDLMRPKKLYIILLTAGLVCIDGDQDVATILVENATAASAKVGDAIYALTAKFISARNKETENAEKNSGQPEKSGE